jgi:hypothetical protein
MCFVELFGLFDGQVASETDAMSEAHKKLIIWQGRDRIQEQLNDSFVCLNKTEVDINLILMMAKARPYQR